MNEWRAVWTMGNYVGSQTKQLKLNERNHGIRIQPRSLGQVLKMNIKACKTPHMAQSAKVNWLSCISQQAHGDILSWDSARLPFISSHLCCHSSLPVSMGGFTVSLSLLWLWTPIALELGGPVNCFGISECCPCSPAQNYIQFLTFPQALLIWVICVVSTVYWR
jgi:hypothetical protein